MPPELTPKEEEVDWKIAELVKFMSEEPTLLSTEEVIARFWATARKPKSMSVAAGGESKSLEEQPWGAEPATLEWTDKSLDEGDPWDTEPIITLE